MDLPPHVSMYLFQIKIGPIFTRVKEFGVEHGENL